MLVLSRGKNQDILIGDNIVVTVTDIRGDKVRIGITAPKDVRIDRREVADKLRKRDGQNEVAPPCRMCEEIFKREVVKAEVSCSNCGCNISGVFDKTSDRYGGCPSCGSFSVTFIRID